MRARFDEELSQLNRELILMGALCEEGIATAAKALLEGDTKLAGKVPPVTADVDEKERAIESMCLKLLLQQQPVASDLRQISAALKMVTDMERIGDNASDIAEIVGFLHGRTGGEFPYLGDMAREVIHMVTDSVDAFVKRDTALAASVVKYDDVVDDLFRKVRAELIALIGRRPEDGEYAVDLLMTAKYFERIGDHAVNIAEWVMFSVTGVHRGEAEP